jgi:hypothetical protein
MTRFRPIVAAAAAALALSPAYAQAPAAPAPVSVAPYACVKPEFPGKVAPDARIKRWINEFKTYADCLKAYIAERNATIDAHAKAAKSAVDEFNASVTEFNNTMKTLQE